MLIRQVCSNQIILWQLVLIYMHACVLVGGGGVSTGCVYSDFTQNNRNRTEGLFFLVQILRCFKHTEIQIKDRKTCYINFLNACQAVIGI